MSEVEKGVLTFGKGKGDVAGCNTTYLVNGRLSRGAGVTCVPTDGSDRCFGRHFGLTE